MSLVELLMTPRHLFEPTAGLNFDNALYFIHLSDVFFIQTLNLESC